ncbi:MAG: hypothetical protein ACYC7D_01155 [Nitrososphaerales archaeon]
MSGGAASGGASSSALIFIVLVVFLIGARAYRTYRGTRFSEPRTIFYIGFYFVFSSFFVADSFYEGVSLIYAIPDAIIFALAAVWSFRFSDKRISFWRTSDGFLFFKGGVIIYLIYIAALVVRLSVDFIVIGPSFLSFAPGIGISASSLLGFAFADMLLMLGIGLLVGRNLRLLKRYQNIKKGTESVPAI